MAVTSALPVRLPFRRRNSSAAITTTSSRPCTVTCCGPSARTHRTSSLNRAFASCNDHCLGRRPIRRARSFDFFVLGFVILVILTNISRRRFQAADRLNEVEQFSTRTPFAQGRGRMLHGVIDALCQFCCKSPGLGEPGAKRASKRDLHFATHSVGSGGFDA